MKKYMVEVFITFADGRDNSHKVYECSGYERAKNWTGECIRLDDVNTFEYTKTLKEKRKQVKRGVYVTIEQMKHWKAFEVCVWENGTDNIVEKFN